MTELKQAVYENDILSKIMSLLHFESRVFFHSSYCGSWATDTSGTGRSTFHLISDGDCWLHLEELEHPVKLEAGDFLIFPRDARHCISSSNGLNCDPGQRIAFNDTGKQTAMVCGYFLFDSPNSNLVINSLPDWMLIKCEQPDIGFRLKQLARMIKAENESPLLGKEAIIDKLTELLFIQVIRHYLHAGKQSDKGLLAALADKRIGEALKAFHMSPGENWSVEKLAESAHLSRSAFSSLFSSILGEPPMQYVTYWRMQMAYGKLLKSRQSIADIAEQVGYSSEPAFRKAFRQVMGITPGMIRKS